MPPTSPPGEPTAPAPHPHEHADESIKETIESIIIAFILAFTFRAYVVEAFIIPTGSMAPTLLGAHLHVTCKQCGYVFNVDWPAAAPPNNPSQPGMLPEPAPPRPLANPLAVTCPMCYFANKFPKGTLPDSGDRILVHKYLYSISPPRRWDVVVFKAPHQPEINFIKRLVGLPNESLYIVEGNIYTNQNNPAAPDFDQGWHIERKSARPDAQRAVWQPVYYSAYIPLDKGARSLEREERNTWSVPWTAVSNVPAWQLANTRTYRYNSDQPGAIAFSFYNNPLLTLDVKYPYNQRTQQQNQSQAVEDVRLAATITPDKDGFSVKLSTQARWYIQQEGQWTPILQTVGSREPDRPVTLTAEIDAAGNASIVAIDPDDAQKILQNIDSKNIGPWRAGSARTVELWYVDQEISLWVNGQCKLKKGFDVSLDRLRHRAELANGWTPHVHIAIAGSPGTLDDVKVDRDLYYGNGNRGALLKPNGTGVGHPVSLRSDQFFCLGDNSPLSQDSRYWGLTPSNQPSTTLDDWVAFRMFPDNMTLEEKGGIVPRELMMGKAFFVYWPAMHRLGDAWWQVIPNFGDMRFIH